MKKQLLLAALSISMLSNAQDYYRDMRVSSYYQEFEIGEVKLLYGDNVVLRNKPSMEAMAIDTLSIASSVTVMENTKKVITVNGRESNWYKVKTASSSGYIAGGLIALDTMAHNGGIYLLITSGPDNDQRFRVRYLKNGDFYGKEGSLGQSQFQLKVDGNRGLKTIEGMLILELFAEACGHDGGQHYIFNDGQRLYNAIHCSSIADGGVFWFDETLEFPDERGWGDHITYEREFGESINEELNITRATSYIVPMEWTEDGFYPNVSELNFKEENY